MLTLHIAEGEKCADALAEVGLIATTSQGGSSAPHKTDWGPAAAFERVVIWQDVDPTNERGVNPGVKYAQGVAELILQSRKSKVEGVESHERKRTDRHLASAPGTAHDAPGVSAADQSGAAIGCGRSSARTTGGLPTNSRDDTDNHGRIEEGAPEIYIVDLRAYWVAMKRARTMAGTAAEAGTLDASLDDGKEFDGRDVYDLILEIGADMMPEVVKASLEAIAEQYGTYYGPTMTVDYPNQPKPPKAAPKGDEARPPIRNWEWGEIEVKGETKKIQAALLLDATRNNVNAASENWPCRLHAPGAKDPILFIDEGNGDASYITKCAAFEQFLHERGEVSIFNGGMDAKFRNYVSMMTLYQDYGRSTAAKEFKAIESHPHEPLMPGHYYLWRAPAYKPDGSKLAEFLEFFKNIATPEQRMLFAAMTCTPLWGGPYKERPAFLLEAPDRNCGKTTLAIQVAKLVGGYFTMKLDKRAEDDFYKRILSIGAAGVRVVIIDNIKKVIDSEMLEKWITEEWISGHMLHHGERQRPNNLTYILTANGARASKDIVTRIFGIPLTKPQKDPDWSRRLNAFMGRWAAEVEMDVLQVLRGPKQRQNFKPGGDERFTLWCDEVLNRVCASRAVAKVVGEVDVARVLEVNNIFRCEHDEDMTQARTFWEGMLPMAAKDAGWLSDVDSVFVVNRPQGRQEISAGRIKDYWEAIFDREVNPTWLGGKLKGHLDGERFPYFGGEPGFYKGKNGLGNNVYYVSQRAMNAFLDARDEVRRLREVEVKREGDALA